jgi:hypothetical protein
MRDLAGARTAFLRTFVFLITYLVITGWGLSCVLGLNWMVFFGIAGFAMAVMLACRWAGSMRQLLQGVAEPLAFWPFILVTAVAAAGVVYPVTMLDSLSYRLPRILMWLQEGKVYHITTAVNSMNYMPHVWAFASIPLIQLGGIELVYLWSFTSWIVLYLIGYDWAFEISGEATKSRWLAFIGSTSTFAVLQAGSSASDLFASVLALLSLRFVLAFERTRDWREIGWAVLSFCLAAGVKPHFAVFGLPLTIWFVVSPSKPWRSFRWHWAPVLLPLWLVCSPVPSFVMNYRDYGSWTGPALSYPVKGKSPVWNIVLGTTMIIWQAPQPPINPAALVFNKQLTQAVINSGIRQIEPRFGLRMTPVSIVDTASLGLVTAALFVTGVLLALRKGRHRLKMWQFWAMAAGLASIWMALTQFVPESSGRTYCGFLYFSLPLAMVGWNLLRPQILRTGVYLCLLSSCTSLILDPAQPLWPVGRMQQMLAKSPRFGEWADKLKLYMLFPERARAGRDLVRAVPDSERVLVVLIGDDHPLLPLFYPYPNDRKLVLLPAHATARELNEVADNYVIVTGGSAGPYPELCDYLEKSGDYTLVLSHVYTSKLSRGPETWKLYQKKSLPKTTAHAP